MKNQSRYFSILFIVFILIIFILSLLMVINIIVTEKIEKNIDSKIDRFRNFAEITKDNTANKLVNDCRILQQNNNLIEAIKNKNQQVIDSVLHFIRDYSEFENILILDKENNILTKSGIFIKYGIVEKYYDLFDNKFFVIKNDSEYFFACNNVMHKSDEVIGRVNIAHPLQNLLKFDNFDSLQIAYINNQELLYSSFEINKDSLKTFLDIHKPVVDAVSATVQSSDLISTKLNGRSVYLKIVPFGFGIPVHLLIATSTSKEFAWLNVLNKYIIALVSIFGLILIFTFVLLIHKYTKLKMKLEKYRETGTQKPGKSKFEDHKLKTGIGKTKEKAAILVSKIIYPENKSRDSLQDIFGSYQKIQEELVELYEGSFKKMKGENFFAVFKRNEESLGNVVQCAKDIMKIINKESQTTNCRLTICINFGILPFETNGEPALSGNAFENAENFIQIAKPGQILIQESQARLAKIETNGVKSKVWKFKNIDGEVRLVDVG